MMRVSIIHMAQSNICHPLECGNLAHQQARRPELSPETCNEQKQRQGANETNFGRAVVVRLFGTLLAACQPL